MDCFFFFNDTATTEIYTLSLHDALPIYHHIGHTDKFFLDRTRLSGPGHGYARRVRDRKSTRLNSSHVRISYAVFCLKKKVNNAVITQNRDLPSIYPRNQVKHTRGVKQGK